MSAVFDTSPLCYLVLIDEPEIAPGLFDEVFIPQAVAGELKHPGAPEALKHWMSAPPDWLKVRDVEASSEPKLRGLHPGEREAILLTQRLPADWLVVDEMAGRRVALSLDLRVTGLLGLLGKAAQRQMVDLGEAVRRLKQTRFRVADSLLEAILEEKR